MIKRVGFNKSVKAIHNKCIKAIVELLIAHKYIDIYRGWIGRARVRNTIEDTAVRPKA